MNASHSQMGWLRGEREPLANQLKESFSRACSELEAGAEHWREQALNWIAQGRRRAEGVFGGRAEEQKKEDERTTDEHLPDPGETAWTASRRRQLENLWRRLGSVNDRVEALRARKRP